MGSEMCIRDSIGTVNTCLPDEYPFLGKSDDKDNQFMSSYPFNTDNVKRFAEFCRESGGFEIC